MLQDLGPVTAGLTGALAFGAGDFAGSRASLRMNGLSAVALAQVAAALTAMAVLTSSGGVIPSGPQYALAASAGLFHVIAVFFLYQGMARGRVSVIAPIAGVVGIAVPVIADMGFIKLIAPIHLVGILLAAVAIVLISRSGSDEEDRALTAFSIKYGIISGMGYGFADMCLGLMTIETAVGGLAIARMTGAGLAMSLYMIFLASRAMSASQAYAVAPASSAPAMPAPDRTPVLITGVFLCALAGVLDCVGQLGYVLSATQGQMSVAAALIAFYPAVSVALAVVILNERIGAVQMLGLLLSLCSIALLSQ